MTELADTPEKTKRIDLSTAHILRRWLSEKIHINPAYSLRAMSRSLGVSPGFLSQLMNGKKKLPLARAIEFSQIMKLSETAADELIRSVNLDSAKDPKSRQKLKKALNSQTDSAGTYRQAELERFKILSRWYHVAVLDLIETEDFKSDSAWIAKRLKISQVQAQDAMARLKEFELITYKNKRWQKTDALLGFYARQSNAAIREHHKQMIGKALEHLEDARPEAFEKRSITGMTLSIEPELLPEAFALIDQFRKKMQKFLSTDASTEVYQMNIQLFNLSHDVPTKEAQA